MIERVIIASLAMTVMLGQEATPDARFRNATVRAAGDHAQP